mgnify:FL=1
MSAMTRSMAPWEHELSQMVGLAVAVLAANPAAAVPVRFEFAKSVIALEIMLLDFDAECEEMSLAIDRKLSDWRAEIDWANYEVRQVIGAAA